MVSTPQRSARGRALSLSLAILFVALALVVACGGSGDLLDLGTPDAGGSQDGGAHDGGSTDAGGADGGHTDGGTDGGATDGGHTDGGSPDAGSPDGGGVAPSSVFGMTDVYVNQGVGITVAKAGAVLPVAQRETDILKNRPGLLRALVQVGAGWTAQDLVGQLMLSGAVTRTVTVQAHVAAASQLEDPSTGFNWPLLATDFQPGVKFQIVIATVGSTKVLTTWPAAPADLNVSAATMKLEATIVRVSLANIARSNFGSYCQTPDDLPDGTPNVTDEYLNLFRNTIYEMNPVNEISVDVHPTILKANDTDFGHLLDQIYALKQADGVPLQHYYFGIADTCSGSYFGSSGGLAYPWDYVSGAIWWYPASYKKPSPDNYYFSFVQFTHEVGHDQGMHHMDGCGAGSPFEDYPTGGAIEDWGYEVLGTGLLSGTGGYAFVDAAHPRPNASPNHWTDYMGYCNFPWNWVTLHTWKATALSIAQATSAATSAQAVETLVGVFGTDGSEAWHTTQSYLGERDVNSADTVQVTLADGSVQTSGLYRTVLDNGAVYVAARLPDRASRLQRIELVTEQGRREIAKALIRERPLKE